MAGNTFSVRSDDRELQRILRETPGKADDLIEGLARLRMNLESAGGLPPSLSGSGAPTPDSRERPALIGDQVDADVSRLRSLSVGPWAAESESSHEMAKWYADCANRYEIISGAYFATWRRETQALAGGRSDE